MSKQNRTGENKADQSTGENKSENKNENKPCKTGKCQ